MNIKTKRMHWVTVGYIPMVLLKYESGAKQKPSASKAELLQRSLYLIFGPCMNVSHTGCLITLQDGTTKKMSPRVPLNYCDYPEKRSQLSLKQHGGKLDCTLCLADSQSFSGRPGLNQRKRNVIETVTA